MPFWRGENETFCQQTMRRRSRLSSVSPVLTFTHYVTRLSTPLARQRLAVFCCCRRFSRASGTRWRHPPVLIVLWQTSLHLLPMVCSGRKLSSRNVALLLSKVSRSAKRDPLSSPLKESFTSIFSVSMPSFLRPQYDGVCQ